MTSTSPARPNSLTTPEGAREADPRGGCAGARDGHLRRSAEFLEFAQAAGGFGVYDLDLASGGISGTPLYFELIGLRNRDQWVSREEWVATIHPEDLEADVVELGAAIDLGSSYQSEYRALLVSGEMRWLASRGEVIRDADGNPARIVGTLSDITQRKQLEEKLRYATESLDIAQAAAGLATFDFNIALNSHVCSANFCSLLGLPPSTPLDDLNRLLARVHPDDAARSRSAPLETTPEDPSYRCQYRVMLDGGGHRWIGEKATVTRDKSGKVARITGAIVDISDLKRAEAALDSAEARLERAVRGTQDGLWEIDMVTDTLWFGPHFEEMLGYSFGELSESRERYRAMIHPEDREMVRAIVQNHLEHGAIYDVEYRAQHKAGHYEWLPSRAQSERPADGRALRVAGS